jgi:spermidine synthase
VRIGPPNIGIVLKIAIFATGCAGIVAEFVLSTLATYLLGNAVVQWTLVMSLMLFAMGVGSRLSRFFCRRLLDTFILIEFSLSVLCAVSAVLVYSLSAFIEYTALLIYLLAFGIGALIGFEIPLVTRINDGYEELRINISGIMEKDYYGALAGGMLFVFVALPYLGLTYTPIVLGAINFGVASLILWRFYELLERKKSLVSAFGFVVVFLTVLAVLARPIILYGEQRKYRDKIIYTAQSPYQKIVMTQWKNHYWLYLNGQEQFSTYDEERYHEPLVHPAMKLSPGIQDVLILGGGDGLALREVLKYNRVQSVTLVDIDPVMTELGRRHPILVSINKGSLANPKVRIINQDAAQFVQEDTHLYGVIIIDLPDPDSIDLMHVYSKNFYETLRHHLIRGGVLAAQATSPYFSQKAFLCILKTIQHAGFTVLPYHNHIPTMGEWGWVLGVDEQAADPDQLKSAVARHQFNDVETRYINQDAVISMTHFGKGILDESLLSDIIVNTEINPVLHRYYLSGQWGVY